MIYIVSYADRDQHYGYYFTGSKGDARKKQRTFEEEHSDYDPDCRVIEEPTPKTKKQWLGFLNRHASHPDNG